MLSRTRAAARKRIRRMVSRLLGHWIALTYNELAAGRAWYRRAIGEVRRLSRLTGIPARQVAGVIAALSPRCRWDINKRWAESVLLARAAGRPCPVVGLGHCRRKAWAISGGADPAAVLRGPKVVRFWECLTGTGGDSVAIDVWAAKAALGNRAPRRGPAGRRYLELERAYQIAAGRIGIPARELQAGIWVQIRGTAD